MRLLVVKSNLEGPLKAEKMRLLVETRESVQDLLTVLEIWCTILKSWKAIGDWSEKQLY